MKNKIVFFIIAIIIIFIIVKSYNEGFISENTIIKEKLDSLNAELPLIYQDYSRLDKVELIGKRKLKYKITLIKIDNNTLEVFIKVLKNESFKRSEEDYKKNPKMKDFRDNNFEIHNVYYNKNGKFLFENIIKPILN